MYVLLVQMYVRMYVCMYVCMCVHMYVCMYVSTYVLYCMFTNETYVHSYSHCVLMNRVRSTYSFLSSQFDLPCSVFGLKKSTEVLSLNTVTMCQWFPSSMLFPTFSRRTGHWGVQLCSEGCDEDTQRGRDPCRCQKTQAQRHWPQPAGVHA